MRTTGDALHRCGSAIFWVLRPGWTAGAAAAGSLEQPSAPRRIMVETTLQLHRAAAPGRWRGLGVEATRAAQGPRLPAGRAWAGCDRLRVQGNGEAASPFPCSRKGDRASRSAVIERWHRRGRENRNQRCPGHGPVIPSSLSYGACYYPWTRTRICEGLGLSDRAARGMEPFISYCAQPAPRRPQRACGTVRTERRTPRCHGVSRRAADQSRVKPDCHLLGLSG